MGENEDIITTRGLTKRYRTAAGTVTAVNNLSIAVPRGRLTILRGRSGSGKTTLINLLGALDGADEGSVLFDGAELLTLPENGRDRLRRTQMGFVFQSVALMGDMTAAENVDFALRIAGVPGKERKSRVAECLARVGLAGRAKHLPPQLSGGEQQRVAIARAIAHRPAVVFADEPTAQLDSQMALQIVRLFLQLAEEDGLTLVMATHDPEMMEVAHRVYTLRDGEVQDEQ